MKRCKICGCDWNIEVACDCIRIEAAARRTFKRLNTCQTCKHGLSGIGHRGSTDVACDLSDDWVVPSNGVCNQHPKFGEEE
jgi:hypothetical protein